MFAHGSGLRVQDYNSDFGNSPILIRSMGKRKLIKWCWANNHTFYYMDSGYIGNYKSQHNPLGSKIWHRIVKNDVQHTNIIERPGDRLSMLDITFNKRKRGRHILIVAPSEKPCKFYNVDLNAWLTDTISNIRKYTDRPIKIRHKQSRTKRMERTIYDDLLECHAVVTFQSIAAVESIFAGIPAFTLAPTAADPVGNKDLSFIEDPYFPDHDLMYSWACHLSYSQYHISEFKNGKAYEMIINENC